MVIHQVRRLAEIPPDPGRSTTPVRVGPVGVAGGLARVDARPARHEFVPSQCTRLPSQRQSMGANRFGNDRAPGLVGKAAPFIDSPPPIRAPRDVGLQWDRESSPGRWASCGIIRPAEDLRGGATMKIETASADHRSSGTISRTDPRVTGDAIRETLSTFAPSIIRRSMRVAVAPISSYGAARAVRGGRSMRPKG